MSISGSDRPRRVSREAALAIGLVVSAAAIYRATTAASVSGLFPPDLPPAASLPEPRIVEFLARASSGLPAWLSIVCATCALLVSYLAARRLGATRRTSVASVIALAFGRVYWGQAGLPGVEPALALAGALAIWGALHTGAGRGWLVLCAGATIAASAPFELHRDFTVSRTASWLFLEMNAAGISLALTGLLAASRSHRAAAAAVAIAVWLLITAPFRIGDSTHAALVPAFAALAPFVALGATGLISWLGSRAVAWALPIALALIPLLGNARHVLTDTGRASRARLTALTVLDAGCGTVAGLVRATESPDAEAIVWPDRAGCATFLLPDARNAYEHLGFRFTAIDVPQHSVVPDEVRAARLSARHACVSLSPATWTDVTSLADQGRLGILLPRADASGVVLYAARERPLEPWIASSWSVIPPALTHRAIESDTRVSALTGDDLHAEGLATAPALHRITVSAGSTTGPASLTSLDLSGLPDQVLARARGNGATVCPAPRGAGLFENETTRQVSIRGRRSAYGDGWGPGEGRGGREWRRTTAPEGELLIGLTRALSLDVTVSTQPSAGIAGTVALRVNGTRLPAVDRDAGRTHRWSVPSALWKPGVNQVFIAAAIGTRVSDVTLTRAGDPPAR